MSFKVNVSGIKTSMKKTFQLYSGLGWKSFFVKIRFWDAPYIEIEKLIPKKGKILDLGCGEGIFTNFLAIKSSGREIIGIDIDNKRISQAKKAGAKLSNIKFIKSDVTKLNLVNADTIVMVHLLHHLSSFGAQEELIKQSQEKLKRGGYLIIVEVEPEFSFKYLVTWVTDHFIVPLLFEKRVYSSIFFRKSRDWGNLLRRNGFKCQIVRADKGHPFTHIILKCKKN